MYKLGILLTYYNYHNLEMSLEEKEQEQQQLKKIKDEGNLAINIMEEILQEIGQVKQEAVKVKEAPQMTEIKKMQLIIEWKKEKIKKEMDKIKKVEQKRKREQLINKLEQLQAINIEQEMGQAKRKMENVRNEVQQLMHQIEIILSKGEQENPNCTLDNRLQVLRTLLEKNIQRTQLYSEFILNCLQHDITTNNNVSEVFKIINAPCKVKVIAINEVLKGAQQVHSNMRQKMNEIQQEMQQLQEKAKLIKDNAQKLQQQTEKELHSQYIKEQMRRILHEKTQQIHEGNQEFEQQYAQLLQLTLILQNQMQWLQEQAKIIKNRATKALDWNEYCMKIACLAAQRSKDPSTPVS